MTQVTVDLAVLDLHAIELAARTRLPLEYTRESLLRLVEVLKPAAQLQCARCGYIEGHK